MYSEPAAAAVAVMVMMAAKDQPSLFTQKKDISRPLVGVWVGDTESIKKNRKRQKKGPNGALFNDNGTIDEHLKACSHVPVNVSVTLRSLF